MYPAAQLPNLPTLKTLSFENHWLIDPFVWHAVGWLTYSRRDMYAWRMYRYPVKPVTKYAGNDCQNRQSTPRWPDKLKQNLQFLPWQSIELPDWPDPIFKRRIVQDKTKTNRNMSTSAYQHALACVLYKKRLTLSLSTLVSTGTPYSEYLII